MADMTVDTSLVEQPEQLGEDSEGESLVPDPYEMNEENKKKISSRMDKRLGVDKFSRSRFEQSWFRNICFLVGQQDLIVDNGRFRLKNTPAWYPKVQTNKFKEKSRDLVSAVMQGRVPIRYFPATEDPASTATAEIGERVREVIYDEAKIDLKENELASWFVNTGNSFLLPYYDYDEKFGMMPHPLLECGNCSSQFGAAQTEESGIDPDMPTCPTCAPQLAELGQPPSLLQQSPDTEMLPIGSLCTDVCSPFEIRADARVRDYKDWSWFIRQRRYDVSFAKEKWGYDAGSSEKEEPGGSLSQHYLDVIAQINSTFDPKETSMGVSSGESKSPKVTAYIYYQLPDEDFPEGVRALRLGSGAQNVVELSPLDTEYGAGVKQGKKFLPIVHLRAEVVPGRLWGDTPLNEAIPLQLFRNVVERIIKLEVQRMANSVWLDPKGSGVTNYTGGPGLVLTYNPLTLGGTTPVKPERLPPQLNHLSMLLELLKFIDDSIERVTGTYFLQGGDAPSGVTAACLTNDTECLTQEGWKRKDALKMEDLIYSFDPAQDKAIWSPLLAINSYQYKGKMHDIDGREVSAMVTPNHAWYVGSNNEGSGKYAKGGKLGHKVRSDKGIKRRLKYIRKETTELSTSDYLPASFPLSGEVTLSEERIAYLEVLGWVFSEGNYYKNQVEISQSEKVNAPKCELIRKSLNSLGVEFRESLDKRHDVVRFRFTDSFAAKIMQEFPDKIPTQSFISSLSAQEADLVVKTMLLGDGHERTLRGEKEHHTRVFASADARLIDLFQQLATIAGYQTAQPAPYPGAKRHKKPQYGDMQRVSIKKSNKNKLRNLLPNMKEVDFEGEVWCPTVSTGAWIARRNGKVFVTGNSALALLDEKAKKAMSPLIREWAKGFLSFDEMALEIARQHWTDARIRLISGKNKKWDTQKFMASDLQGAVSMEIDYQSMFPKSNATEIAQISQLIEGAVLNPQDPEQKMEILKKFGMMYMLGSYDLDVKQAQKEQARFIEEGVMPNLVPLIQNSLVHFMQHSDFAKTDEFDELAEEQKDMWYAHVQAHAADMGERRALFTMMGINPDDPQTSEIGTGAAQAGIGGAQQVMGKPSSPPNQGKVVGSRVGSRGPRQAAPGKGQTGGGANQVKAQQALANPAPPSPLT